MGQMGIIIPCAVPWHQRNVFVLLEKPRASEGLKRELDRNEAGEDARFRRARFGDEKHEGTFGLRGDGSLDIQNS